MPRVCRLSPMKWRKLKDQRRQLVRLHEAAGTQQPNRVGPAVAKAAARIDA